MQQDQRKKNLKEVEFFTEYGDSNRYKILEVIGKGSYGVVCAAIDTHTGEKVAIKKITNTFEHLSDAIRILREVKLLRLLRHPDIVEIKRIMLPPSKRDFKDIYVVFELMESDLHQVIKANDDLTHDHHRFFLYQMLRALKYMHTANVYHRDLKPKNILANANCKLKICDLGLARVAFNDTPSTIIWTDYVATRWYRAPELCGSFFSKYTPAIDIWSIGCIFAEVLTGKPLFPGKSVVHQLDLITDLLGTPSADSIAGVRNEKARRYLSNMRKKQPVPFSQKFPNSDPSALPILKRLLAFDPKDRPTAEEALADPYFKGLSKLEREPSCQPISKLEFEFERRGVTKEDVRQLLFREILEYHPQLLKDHIAGNEGSNFLYPSAVGQFRRQFAYLEENGAKNGPVVPPERKHVSLPRSTVNSSAVTTHPNLAASFGRSRQVTEENGDSNKATDSSKQSRWLPAGMPEKVVGPMLLGDKARSMNDGRSGSFAPHGISSHYVPNTIPTNRIRPVREFGSDSVLGRKQQPAEHTIINMAAVVGPHTAIDIRSNPYYSPQVKAAGKLNDQIALNARLLQEQAQLGAIGATAVAVSAQRKVRTV